MAYLHRGPYEHDRLNDGGLDSLLLNLPPSANVYSYDAYGRLSTDRASGNYYSEYPDLQSVTYVKGVDLKVRNNGINHHTERYAISLSSMPNPRLVVRRGQPFNIDIELSRPFDERSAYLSLVFGLGNAPSMKHGTYVDLPLYQNGSQNQWVARIVSSSGNTITVEVTPPPYCAIGKWSFAIDSATSNNRFRYGYRDPIYIIFNPWNRDDAVFMDNTNLLAEYVLNEDGKIYVGNHQQIGERHWRFGQFQANVLDTAIYLLDHVSLRHHERYDPVIVIRKISAVVNNADENGVVVGNWSEDYTGGTPPTNWTSSVTILEQFWQTKTPVKYGQCWVYAGVANTVARALGIPSRVVSNFESAIDGDASFTLERYLDPNGYDLTSQDDSIWNFHVWNEAWMTRPDLPSGYGGWQVYDATPKTTSDGVMCCGPTSVAAILQGDVNLKYDGQAAFVDVNGDIFYWWPDPRGAWLCVMVDKNRVGKALSTKAAFSNEREDITHNYKYPEGTHEERATVKKAMKLASKVPVITKYYESKADDIIFTSDLSIANVMLGGNFEVTLRMKNTSREKRTLSGRISVKSLYYTGGAAFDLKEEPLTNLALQPGEERVHKITITAADYNGKLRSFYNVSASFWVHVVETGQIFVTTDRGRLLKPKMLIKAPMEIQVNREFTIELSFTNPTSQELTNCIVTLDGLSLAKRFIVNNVPASGTFQAVLPYVATSPGNLELVALFNSTQLEEVIGTQKITVHDA